MTKKIIIYPIYLLVIAVLLNCSKVDKTTEESKSEKTVLVNSTQADEYQEMPTFKVPIPDSLIEKIKKFQGDFQAGRLISTELLQNLSDTAMHGKEVVGTINPIFVDLDGDFRLEIIGLFDLVMNYGSLAIFKQIEEQWYCLFFEDFGHHYRDLNISIVNNSSKEKVFYINALEDRGSGIFKDVHHFFKLIDDQVVHCLRLINEGRIHGWGLYLNQEVTTSFQFDNSNERIWVLYDYHYFPGPILEKDVSWASHPEIEIIKDTKGIHFEWHENKKQYIPAFKDGGIMDGLTKKQLLAFEQFGNDKLITEAFKDDFDKILLNGTEHQKKIVSKYLEMVKKDQKANVPSGEIEQLGETKSGLKFYGKKKE